MLKMVLYAMNKEIWSVGRGLSEVQGSAKRFADPVHWGYVSSEMPLEVVRYSHARLVEPVTVLNSLSSKSLCGQNVMETTSIGRLAY